MIHWDYFDAPEVGRLTLVADAEGLRHITFPQNRHPVTVDAAWRRNPEFFSAVRAQLGEYFAGRRRAFQLPLAPRGTPFQMRVWTALGQIPYGATVSYQWLAERIGNGRAARAVGGAVGRNPLPIVVPCHRVIGRNGQLVGFGGGLNVKAHLLDLERRNP